MGKKSAPKLPEAFLNVPRVPSLPDTHVTPIYDTHTHLHSTFAAYSDYFPNKQYQNIRDFVRGYYGGPRTPEENASLPEIHVPVKSIVDVWCETSTLGVWRELADSACTPELRAEHWGDIDYHFVMGIHPHEARNYNDEVEAQIKEAMQHPRNVGWGEIGLDYHYDNSPRDVQKEVLIRQLKCAVELGKPITIHTREADEDIWEILSTHVPKHWKIHIHCFTDAPELAQRLLDHFPNLYIGITGVITYATNHNTDEVVRRLATSTPSDPTRSPLRILLETDAPYMAPANLTRVQQQSLNQKSNARMPLCHTGMIPWTAEFVATIANEGAMQQAIKEVETSAKSTESTNNHTDTTDRKVWTAAEVMRIARDNAKAMYGI